MGQISQITTTAGLSFSSETSASDNSSAQDVMIGITHPAQDAKIQLSVSDFLLFADFVEDTRTRLLQNSGK